jgi:hypothetical protein
MVMNASRTLSFCSIITFMVLLTACSGTRVTGVWKKSDYAGPPFKSLMVVGLTGELLNKALWENIMADRLRQNGLTTALSVNSFPADGVVGEREIINLVIARNIDGVLVTRLVDTRLEQVYLPPLGAFYDEPYGYYSRFSRYYPYAYHRVYSPGYTSTFTTVLLETNLYDAATQQLIWSMSTDTVGFDSGNEVVEEVSRKVVDLLRRDGLIR